MSVNITSPSAGIKLNVNIPVEIKGTASSEIFSLRFSSPSGTRDYLLGTTKVVNGNWSFAYQFNTAGNRKLAIDGLDATGTKITTTLLDFILEDLSTDSTDTLVLASPANRAALDLETPIEFKGTADSNITKVSLRSPLGGTNYSLGTTSVNSGRWSISYKFSRGGTRKVIVDGIDGSGNRVATVSVEIILKFVSIPGDDFDGKGWVGMENTTQEFRDKVVKIAERLGTKPLFLMAAMSFETGGTFSARIQNSVSLATGLIQFMDFTANSLGTSINDLKQMTPVKQLDYVEKYFHPFMGRLKTLEDVYMAILWPAAVGKNRGTAIFSRPSIEYDQNRGLDTDRNGHVTVGEAATLVKTRIIE